MRGLKDFLPGAGRKFKILADEIDQTAFSPALRGTNWYVNPNDATADDDRSEADNGKSWTHPFETMAEAFTHVQSGDTIYFTGNIAEEVTASNLLEDVTIVGVANRPRHADHARDAATYDFSKGYGGATWREAASHTATTPLLTLRGQGWRLVNFLMVPPSDAAAIKLERNALSDVSEYDPSHLSLFGMRLVGGQSGIEDSGGCFNVHIDQCTFQDNTNGIKTLDTAVAVPLQWVIENSHFIGNTNHLVVDASKWTIRGNTFGNGATVYIKLNQNGSTSGKNMLYANAFAGTYSNVGGYTGSASSDEWGGNWNSISGGVTAADPA